MKKVQQNMKPQDVVVLMKIIALNSDEWLQKPLAEALRMSQSEVSQSVARSQFAGLLDATGKKVMRLAFMEFLQYGLTYVFPEKPGATVRGLPTAHSASPIKEIIMSNELFVWPWSKGKVKGFAIIPLYSSVPEAAENDEKLYELLALTDALRVGRAREKEIAIKELKERILNG